MNHKQLIALWVGILVIVVMIYLCFAEMSGQNPLHDGHYVSATTAVSMEQK